MKGGRMAKIQITNPGVKKALRRYDYTNAIAEYIWNGFDANASAVDIEFDANEIGNISEIRIIDNGYGINRDELNNKFLPFLQSEKEIDPEQARSKSTSHGKNGVGRLTFFKFALRALWETIYEQNGIHYKYNIEIKEDSLNSYEPTEVEVDTAETGTKVTFFGIQFITASNFETDINVFLQREFCWFLELNQAKGYHIRINGQNLDYTDSILDFEITEYVDEAGDIFQIRYFQWKYKLNNEYSRYYFLDSSENERLKVYTTLNNKGDKFYHSVFVSSSYFDDYAILSNEDESTADLQSSLLNLPHEDVYKRLIEHLDEYLRAKRQPFIRKLSNSLIQEYQEKGIFPDFGENGWDKVRELQLTDFVRELYVVEPKIFSKLNDEQEKTFVRLLNLVIDANEYEALLDILKEVVDLNSDERLQLAEVLKSVKLNNLTKTIALIQDRVKAISELRQLITPDFGANEPQHIQKYVEAHYWLFGEQYHLVTAAEPDFEQALRKLLQSVNGEESKIKIDHPDKNKEMDIFAIRQVIQYNKIESIVVELKNPRVALGEKELSQIKRYSRVIQQTADFYGADREWSFILVGNKFDTSGYIQNELESNKHFGERFLVQKVDRIKIYVMNWGEVMTEFEIRHNFLLEKLKLEREHFASNYLSPDELIDNIKENSAALLPTASSLS